MFLVHPACTKHRPAGGIGGLERSPRGSNETIRTTAFPQSTGINSLVVVSGQGRGRTADLPLFREGNVQAAPASCPLWRGRRTQVVAGRSGVGALDDDGRGDGAEPARTRSDRAEGTVPCIEFCHALDVLPGTALTMLVVMRARRESGTGFDVVLDIVVPCAFDGPVARNDLAWLVGLGR
jgi:hypothetical protein